MIYALLAHVYSLSFAEIMQLPISRYNNWFEQAFNIMHLYAGSGGYKLQTAKDEYEQARLEYEAIKNIL